MEGRNALKSKEVPAGLLWGGIGLVVLIVIAVAYTMFFQGTPQTDLSKLTPQQLSDPDPPRSPRVGHAGS